MYTFFSIIIYGYIIIASLLVFFIWRDLNRPNLFFNKHKYLTISSLFILIVGILTASYTYFIEPNLLLVKNTEIKSKKIENPIKIAFLSDLQVGNHKKTKFVEKITQKIVQLNPDLILLGGDLIDNEGTFEDETKYLEPLGELVNRYPIYYVLGNHEYGIGAYLKNTPKRQAGDKSEWLIKKMEELNIPLLQNNLDCLKIKEQDICIFGADDIWHADSLPLPGWELEGVEKEKFLIFLTHNPDGILYWPNDTINPDLTLAGHTHGGQIYLPFVGPLGDPDVKLPKKYWRDLNYYEGIPLLTSVGVGESGGKLRFMSPPTIEVVNLKPKMNVQ